jgi:hypothetical protein
VAAATAAAEAVAAATANGGREMSGDASVEDASPLEARRQALLVAPVRIALGVAGVLAAVSIDLSAGTAVAEAGLGAGLTIFTLVAPGGRRRPERLRPPARPPAQGRQPWWRVLAVAMFPSTYGVAVLTAIALVFNRDLAAFLAGVLLGMGAAALVYALTRSPA